MAGREQRRHHGSAASTSPRHFAQRLLGGRSEGTPQKIVEEAPIRLLERNARRTGSWRVPNGGKRKSAKWSFQLARFQPNGTVVVMGVVVEAGREDLPSFKSA